MTLLISMRLHEAYLVPGKNPEGVEGRPRRAVRKGKMWSRSVERRLAAEYGRP